MQLFGTTLERLGFRLSILSYTKPNASVTSSPVLKPTFIWVNLELLLIYLIRCDSGAPVWTGVTHVQKNHNATRVLGRGFSRMRPAKASMSSNPNSLECTEKTYWDRFISGADMGSLRGMVPLMVQTWNLANIVHIIRNIFGYRAITNCPLKKWVQTSNFQFGQTCCHLYVVILPGFFSKPSLRWPYSQTSNSTPCQVPCLF